MYFSLESGLPFLDPVLVTEAFSIVDSKLIVDGYTNAPLRKEGIGKIAQSIVERKDKNGFMAPQEKWQKTILASVFETVFREIGENGLFPFIDTLAIKNF